MVKGESVFLLQEILDLPEEFLENSFAPGEDCMDPVKFQSPVDVGKDVEILLL